MNDSLMIIWPLLFLGVIAFFWFNKNQSNEKPDNSQKDVTLPLRLQAYERMTLFLERLKLENLVMRQPIDALSIMEFQGAILSDIRSELNHNIAQQIYISHDTWELITHATNITMAEINTAFGASKDLGSAREVAKFVLQNQGGESAKAISLALEQLKKEAQKLF
ncbi:DUF7935 family protein [Lacihabitans lacunae]|uniref:DUF2802 domain-containing protein n=1 Tax=Lacihabitans lacunae TaxID=1028214 RepID=A0ABV7YQG0_9BACT